VVADEKHLDGHHDVPVARSTGLSLEVVSG